MKSESDDERADEVQFVTAVKVISPPAAVPRPHAATAPTPTVLGSSSVKCLVITAALMFLTCLVCGIGFWIADGKQLLPTISDTWTIPPASYLSRLFIGYGCLLFQVVNLAIYHANAPVGHAQKTPCHCTPVGLNKFLLFCALLSIFCLSWVGSVCDSAKPTCRGDNDVHLAFAYTFFIFYNMYMFMQMCISRTGTTSGRGAVRGTKLSAGASLALWTVLGVSVLAKLRVLLPVPELVQANGTEGGDESSYYYASYQYSYTPAPEFMTMGVANQDLVALIEWTDVLCILLWTSYYAVKRASNFSLSTVRLSSKASPHAVAKPTVAQVYTVKAEGDNDDDDEAAAKGEDFPLAALNEASVVGGRKESDSGPEMLHFFPSTVFALAPVLLVFFLLVDTFISQVFVEKKVPLPAVLGGNANASWPEEDALWTSQTGNWLARWSLVASSALLSVFLSLLRHAWAQADEDRARTRSRSRSTICGRCFVLLVGRIGAAALALSGVVDQFEDQDFHDSCMSWALAGLNVFSLYAVSTHVSSTTAPASSTKCSRRSSLVVVLVGLVILYGGSISTTVLSAVNATEPAEAVSTAAEWVSTLLFLFSLAFLTWLERSGLSKVGIAITFKEP